MQGARLLTALSLCFAALCGHASAADPSLAVLPTIAPVQARVMQLGMPTAVAKTIEAINAALSAQPEWSKAFLAANQGVKPLPFHPNMRISESEYRALIAATETLSLVQIGTVTLAAERQPDGSLRLVTAPPTSRVNGIVIGGEGDSVTTPFATLMERTPVSNTDPKAATGRWTGTQWHHQVVQPGRLLAVKLALGRRTDQGDGIIYYDVKDVQGERGDVFYEILLFPTGR